MLGKLLKHEFKATARLLLPLYLIFIALTLLTKLIHKLDFIKGVLIPTTITITYFISIVVSLAITLIFTIARFYKNLMTDEGYLMFTLPVKVSALINSKLLMSVFWLMVNIAAVIASLIFVFPFDVKEIVDSVMTQLRVDFGTSANLFIIELVIMILIYIVYAILLVYVSLAIGQLSGSHKILFSAGAFMGIYFIVQILSLICLLIAAYFFKDIEHVNANLLTLVFPLIAAYFILLSVSFYFITRYIFTRRLNLE